MPKIAACISMHLTRTEPPELSCIAFLPYPQVGFDTSVTGKCASQAQYWLRKSTTLFNGGGCCSRVTSEFEVAVPRRWTLWRWWHRCFLTPVILLSFMAVQAPTCIPVTKTMGPWAHGTF